jgi:hypothetical protein
MNMWGQPPSAVRASDSSPVHAADLNFPPWDNQQFLADNRPNIGFLHTTIKTLRSFAPLDSRGRLSPHICLCLRLFIAGNFLIFSVMTNSTS